MVLSGTVTDISAGTEQNQQAAKFPHGVPVSSDASMTEWMGYIYQQKPLPTNFTGVPVSIDVLDSNGNYRHIGTATTDASGAFTASHGNLTSQAITQSSLRSLALTVTGHHTQKQASQLTQQHQQHLRIQ